MRGEGFEPTDHRETLRLASLAGCDSRALDRSRCSLTRTLQERILRPPPFPGLAVPAAIDELCVRFCEGRALRERLPHHGAKPQRCEGRDLNHGRADAFTGAKHPFASVVRSTTSCSLIQILPLCAFVARWRAHSCEGRDLNPRTSTGADLESAAVSGLGYPRTHAWDPGVPYCTYPVCQI